MRRRRRKAAAPAAALLLGFCWAFVATLCSAAAAAPSPSPLASLGTTEDTIPGLPSPVPLDRSPLPRTSLLGYPEGAKFPLKGEKKRKKLKELMVCLRVLCVCVCNAGEAWASG